MELFKALQIILCILVLCTEFLLVVPQTPGVNSVAAQAPLFTPFAAQAPAVTPVAAIEGPPVPGVLQPQPQVTNMIDSLRDAGQFGAMAGLLDGIQMKSLTPMTTWLVPNDAAFSGTNYPKNVTKFLDYHVIRELLPFSRLLTLTVGTRLPTFLGKEFCVVTSNQQMNYSLDNGAIVVPDLYSDNSVAVHGIDSVLDDARFNAIAPSPAAVLPSPISSPTPTPTPTTTRVPSPSPVPAPAMQSSNEDPEDLSPVQPAGRGPLLNITFADSANRPATTLTDICLALAAILAIWAVL